MTTLKEFAVAVKDEISKRLDMEMEVKEVEKNNGVIKVGIMATSSENRIAPILYLEDYFEKYQNSEGTDKFVGICDEIEKQYVYHMNNALSAVTVNLNTDDISYYDKVKDRLYLKAVNANNGFLTTIPHRIIADDIAVYAIVAVKDDMTATTKVTYSLLDTWKVDFDEVYNIADLNTQKVTTSKSTSQVMADCKGITVDEVYEELRIDPVIASEEDQIVISNKFGLHGAAAITNKEALNKARELLNADEMIIIPSSVHELIGTKRVDRFELEEINNMVKAVNHILPPEDVLSDHCYLFDGSTITAVA